MPWTGFPFRHLIEKVQPQSRARYISMQTALKPDQMVGVGEQPWYPWPYEEGLTIEEAMNDLCLLATGAYGKPMPKQNGAPIRLIVPWKFGFKNIKSIVRIEFTAEQPETLWSKVAPNEYGFLGQHQPGRFPIPRWSQATERVIPGIDRVANPHLQRLRRVGCRDVRRAWSRNTGSGCIGSAPRHTSRRSGEAVLGVLDGGTLPEPTTLAQRALRSSSSSCVGAWQAKF